METLQNIPAWILWVIGFIGATGLIEISPLKINPWKWLAKQIGDALNKGVMDKLTDVDKKVDSVEKKLNEHINIQEVETIGNYRQRILRFNDELILGMKHTKEHFDEILDNIGQYMDYCKEHPDFPNGKTKLSIDHIESVYRQCMDNNSFLTKEEIAAAPAKRSRKKKTETDL